MLGSSVTDESLDTLVSLPLLERIDLPDAHITDRGLSVLQRLSGLHKSVSGADVARSQTEG